MQIIKELQNEYGVQRKGDTYMSKERLQKKYQEFVNQELEIAGVFEKEELENLMNKHGVDEFSYNLYEGCNPPVNQIRVDAKYMNNSELVNEIDNSDLDIGCILTFSKKIEHNKQKDV